MESLLKYKFLSCVFRDFDLLDLGWGREFVFLTSFLGMSKDVVSFGLDFN